MKFAPLVFVIAVAACVGTVLNAQALPPLRTWVDQTGRTVKGRILNVQGADVVLQLESNASVTVPVARFSAADQTYVKDWAKSSGKPDPTVAAMTLAWPESVSVDAKKLEIVNGEQNAGARKYVYSSGSFQFTANAPLTSAVMRDIAGDFELVKELFVKLPWGWQPKPEGGGPLFLANLSETEKDFVATGGSDNSSGWSKDGIIFTKFSTLGLKKVGERYARDAKLDRDGEMIGLISRLIMGEMRDFTLPWSGSGFETFLESIAYRSGTFQLAKPERGLKELIAKRGQSGLAPDAEAMVKLLRLTRAQDRSREVLDIRRQNYFYGGLLVYYFGYMDGDGKGTRLHKYYQAMARDATAWRAYSEARKAGTSPLPPSPFTKGQTYADKAAQLNEIVIDGRTDEKLKEEIVTKFKALGIKM